MKLGDFAFGQGGGGLRCFGKTPLLCTSTVTYQIGGIFHYAHRLSSFVKMARWKCSFGGQRATTNFRPARSFWPISEWLFTMSEYAGC